MQNKELKILDYFICVPAHDLGYLGPVSPKLPLSGPNLDLLSIQQSNTAPSCENYAKVHFDAKHLEKGLNREC